MICTACVQYGACIAHRSGVEVKHNGKVTAALNLAAQNDRNRRCSSPTLEVDKLLLPSDKEIGVHSLLLWVLRHGFNRKSSARHNMLC